MGLGVKMNKSLILICWTSCVSCLRYLHAYGRNGPYNGISYTTLHNCWHTNHNSLAYFRLIWWKTFQIIHRPTYPCSGQIHTPFLHFFAKMIFDRIDLLISGQHEIDFSKSERAGGSKMSRWNVALCVDRAISVAASASMKNDPATWKGVSCAPLSHDFV